MTSTDERRFRRIMAIAAICTICVSLVGGWTAAHVRIAVTESQVRDMRESQKEHGQRIEKNQNTATRIEAQLDYIIRRLDELSQRMASGGHKDFPHVEEAQP